MANKTFDTVMRVLLVPMLLVPMYNVVHIATCPYGVEQSAAIRPFYLLVFVVYIAIRLFYSWRSNDDD